MKQHHHKKSYKLQVTSYKFKNKERRITHNGPRITQYGYTLIELMIAVFIGMIIIGATYGAYISQQRSFVAQDQVAEMNTTSKIALDMIANDIRETGFGVSGIEIFNVNSFTNAITATDSSTAADSITLVGGFRRVGTLCGNADENAVSPGDLQLILRRASDSSTWIVNDGDRRNISIAGISFCAIAAAGGPGNSVIETITLQDPVGKAFPRYTDSDGDNTCDDGEGAPVYVIEDVTYQVTGTELQRIWRSNTTQAIAENIDDFQLAYGIDTDNDGVIDMFTDAPAATDRIIRVRINLLASTARPDPNFQGQGNPPPMIENRNHAATNDSMRRRWWQMDVDLRNPI